MTSIMTSISAAYIVSDIVIAYSSRGYSGNALIMTYVSNVYIVSGLDCVIEQ